MGLEQSAKKPDTLLGRSIAEGKYRIARLLGEGAMGRVYLARQKGTEREVAIKVLTMLEASVRARFLQEIRVTSRISHPNIITIYDAGEETIDEGLPSEYACLYMVMEYLDGLPLSDYVLTRGTVPVSHGVLTVNALSADEIYRVFSAICEGMMELGSRGIIHRDLKPENIFCCNDGRVVILDLGIARITADASIAAGATIIDRQGTMAGTLLGSPHCMSPEQMQGAELADVRTDVYAMACVLYFLAMGICPHEDRYEGPADAQARLMFWAYVHRKAEPPTSIIEHRRDLPRRLERINMKGLAHKSDDRYQTAAEFYEPFKNRSVLSDELTPPEGMSIHSTDAPSSPALMGESMPILRAAKMLSLFLLSAAVVIVIVAKLSGSMRTRSIPQARVTSLPPLGAIIAHDASSSSPDNEDASALVPDVGALAVPDAGSPRHRRGGNAAIRHHRRCPPPIIRDGIITNPCY